jgi:hypothetical protein
MQMYGVYSSPNSYSRLRAMFREIQNQVNIMQEAELMRELNENIGNIFPADLRIVSHQNQMRH